MQLMCGSTMLPCISSLPTAARFPPPSNGSRACATLRRHSGRIEPGLCTLNIKYFQDTDTLYIEFRKAEFAETRDLNENTLLNIDSDGYIVAMTMEHAKQRAA